MTSEKLIYASSARGAVLRADPRLAYVIDNIPAVDAVEVVHGRNITKQHPVDEFICSVCGYVCQETHKYVYDEDAEDWSMYEFEFNYCPNCGAKMDGGNEDGNL